MLWSEESNLAVRSHASRPSSTKSNLTNVASSE